jgi:hypothetical protein
VQGEQCPNGGGPCVVRVIVVKKVEEEAHITWMSDLVEVGNEQR